MRVPGKLLIVIGRGLRMITRNVGAGRNRNQIVGMDMPK
jgi:hypothetical protein